MIQVSRLDGKELTLNVLLIETIEAVPDTIITLTTGRRYVVREPISEIVQKAIDYHQSIGCMRIGSDQDQA